MTSATAPSPAPEMESAWSKLNKAAAGNWPHIFEDLAPELREAMANAPYHVPCPVHGGQNGYRLFEHFAQTGRGICNTCGAQKSGFSTLAWVKKWSLAKAEEEVAAWLGAAHTVTRAPIPVAPQGWNPKVPPAVAWAKISEVWRESTLVNGTPAESYLLKRGVWKENIPATLRAHRGLPYFHGKEKTYYGDFPALLAPLRNKEGKLITVHRIFLSQEGGKAEVPDPKKIMPSREDIRGCAIQLYPAEETLGLAEGIETALAVHAVTRMPVWACFSAVLMELVELPDCVKHVVIWADLDRSGRGSEAADRLADRLEKKGVKVEVHYPPVRIPDQEKGIDWLDVMGRIGLNGFPAKWRRWRPAMTPASSSENCK